MKLGCNEGILDGPKLGGSDGCAEGSKETEGSKESDGMNEGTLDGASDGKHASGSKLEQV